MYMYNGNQSQYTLAYIQCNMMIEMKFVKSLQKDLVITIKLYIYLIIPLSKHVTMEGVLPQQRSLLELHSLPTLDIYTALK